MSSSQNRWIKIHEGLLDWEWFSDSYMCKLWIYLLLRASWKDARWRGIEIPRGSFVTSLDELSKTLGISVRQARYGLEKLKATREIVTKIVTSVSRRYLMITICKYEDYQVKEEGDCHADCHSSVTKMATYVEDIEIYKEISSYEDTKKGGQAAVSSPSPFESAFSESGEKGGISDADAEDGNLFGSDGKTPETAEKSGKARQSVPFQRIQSFWNSEIVNLPRIASLSEQRQNKLRLRWAEWGRIGEPWDVFRTIARKCNESPFLRGDNGRSWKAGIDWLIENSGNWAKVYEGNYDESENQKDTTTNRTTPKGGVKKSVNEKWKKLVQAQSEQNA